MDNYEIADAFALLAKLMDIHGENSFKAKSYAVAAFNIEKLPVQISDTQRPKINSLKGIGESVGKKVVELLDTGELGVLKEYVEKTPPGVLEMLYIKGLGPKKINTLWKELGIETLGELQYACEENRLLTYKGFGEKTQDNIRKSVEFYLQNQGSYLFAQVENMAIALDKKLKEKFPDDKMELTGAFRRQMEIIEVLEWVTTVSTDKLKKYFSSARVEEETDETLFLKTPENVRLKFYSCKPKSFFTKLFSTSCSNDFLEEWRKHHDEDDHDDEESIFRKAGRNYISPYLRESSGALSKTFDHIIQPGDVRGIIHSHSNWSDGVNTIEEMVKGAVLKGYEYLVISDHSKSAFYANGLSEERIHAQQEQIDEINQKNKSFKVFKSIECDILNDGSLDYSDDILRTFDLVIISVHSNLKMTEEKAMARLLKALENPYVTILGHMTGRLLLSRPGYPVDHKKIIDACKANDVVIELNAHPRRLDMDWRHIDYAQDKGVMISVDPDAHSIDEYDNVRYGVLSAQKGGLLKMNNLSSKSLKEFENWLKKN